MRNQAGSRSDYPLIKHATSYGGLKLANTLDCRDRSAYLFRMYPRAKQHHPTSQGLFDADCDVGQHKNAVRRDFSPVAHLVDGGDFLAGHFGAGKAGHLAHAVHLVIAVVLVQVAPGAHAFGIGCLEVLHFPDPADGVFFLDRVAVDVQRHVGRFADAGPGESAHRGQAAQQGQCTEACSAKWSQRKPWQSHVCSQK